jgi:endonuclease YncB( thermonuclease family)
VRPGVAAPPAEVGRAGALVALVTILGVLTGCEATTSPEAGPRPDATATQGSKDGSGRGAREKRRKREQRQERQREQRQEQQRPSTGRTFLVTHVVDGDTLDLADGRRVRLVGMDTPEVGECGFAEAAAALTRLTLGKRVTLVPSDEDRDQYGRLLRYVDVAGVDVGLRLIQRGLAIARYDSRDGYGFHPREPRYIAADTGARQLTCAPKPQPFVPQQPSAGDDCAAGYDPCVPPYPPDVDCADVDGPIRVSGSDPHRLDADGDGVACE